MIKNNLKIIIPIFVLILAIAIYVLSLNFTSKKTIEISANGQIKIELNHFNKTIKTTALDSNGQRILDDINSKLKDPGVMLKSIIDTSNNLNPLTSNDKIDILFTSNNLLRDTSLVSFISTEAELMSSELSLNTQINQYKLTKKDYSAVNAIKRSTGYRTFDILDQGFISKESSPYIVSILHKGDSFDINFSRDVVFNGQEKVYCYYGDKVYETSPAGYGSNKLAVFVSDNPTNVSLKFDVSIKEKENLYGYAIAFVDNGTSPKNVEITFSIDNQKNTQKLEEIHSEILNSDINEQDKSKLLEQYEQLLSTVDRISTNEQLNDFNIMYQNLHQSLNALTKDATATTKPTISPTKTPTPSPTNTTAKPTTSPIPTTTPVATPTPTQTPTPSPTPVDFDKLNSSYYNELNGYKAIVLSIKNADERNTINKQINNLYYELSISKTQEDYDSFEQNLDAFLINLQPYR